MQRSATKLDQAMQSALTMVAAVAVVLSIGALLYGGWQSALGVALGGLTATVNLWLIALVVKGVIEGGRGGRSWAIVGAAKLLALLVGVWLLMQSDLVSGFALALGYGSLPLGITLSTLLRPR